MTNSQIDELRRGDWMKLPRTDSSFGYALFREGFRAVVFPSEDGDCPWEWHIEESMTGVANTAEGGMQEVDEIIERLVELRKAGKLVVKPAP
jgi:hypothetical protein